MQSKNKFIFYFDKAKLCTKLRPMKKRINFQIPILAILFMLKSCTAQGSDNYLEKYKMAVVKYEHKDYYNALLLFGEIIPLLKGKKEIVSAHFYQAYAYFYEKSYRKSARCFSHFYKVYPRIPQAEEAMYMHGYSLYLLSPDIRLEQTMTKKSLKVFKHYIHKYPTGQFAEKALAYIKELQEKLTLKAFKNAKIYYQLAHYKAALVSLAHFQTNYEPSIYHEKAAYIKAKAQYKLAIASTQAQKTEELNDAYNFCKAYLDEYTHHQGVYEKQQHHITHIKKIYEKILAMLSSNNM